MRNAHGRDENTHKIFVCKPEGKETTRKTNDVDIIILKLILIIKYLSRYKFSFVFHSSFLFI
jgi:hypothetical protein